jgi:hypothetical protein
LDFGVFEQYRSEFDQDGVVGGTVVDREYCHGAASDEVVLVASAVRVERHLGVRHGRLGLQNIPPHETLVQHRHPERGRLREDLVEARLSQYDLVALPRRLPHLLGPRHGGAERRGVSRLGGHHPDRHLGRGVQIVQLLQKSTFALARPEIGACRRRFRALATYGSFTAAARTWGRCSTVLRKSRAQRLASLPTTLHWSFLSGKASRMCWRRSRSDTYRLSLLLEQSARAASLVVPQWCAITVAQLPVAAHVQLVRDVQERHRVLRVPPFSGGVRVVDSEHWGEIRRRQPLVHAEPHRGGDHDIAVPFFLRVRVLVADEPGRRTRYPDVRRTQSLGELQSGVAANVASFWHRSRPTHLRFRPVRRTAGSIDRLRNLSLTRCAPFLPFIA